MADNKRQIAEAKEHKKEHDELMAELFNKLYDWEGKNKKPKSNRNERRDSLNNSRVTFRSKNKNMDVPRPIPIVEGQIKHHDMAYENNNGN